MKFMWWVAAIAFWVAGAVTILTGALMLVFGFTIAWALRYGVSMREAFFGL